MELTPLLLQLATQALDLVLVFKRPADAVLSAFFREHRKLGSHDRALVAEAVFGVLRRYRYLSFVVPAANPRTLIIAWLIKARGMSGATFGKLLSVPADERRTQGTDSLRLQEPAAADQADRTFYRTVPVQGYKSPASPEQNQTTRQA